MILLKHHIHVYIYIYNLQLQYTKTKSHKAAYVTTILHYYEIIGEQNQYSKMQIMKHCSPFLKLLYYAFQQVNK